MPKSSTVPDTERIVPRAPRGCARRDDAKRAQLWDSARRDRSRSSADKAAESVDGSRLVLGRGTQVPRRVEAGSAGAPPAGGGGGGGGGGSPVPLMVFLDF